MRKTKPEPLSTEVLLYNVYGVDQFADNTTQGSGLCPGTVEYDFPSTSADGVVSTRYVISRDENPHRITFSHRPGFLQSLQ